MVSCATICVYQGHGRWRREVLPEGVGNWLNDCGSRWIVPFDNARWIPPFWPRLWMDLRCGRTIFDAIESGDPIKISDECGGTVVTRQWTVAQQHEFEAFVRQHRDAANAPSGFWLTNSTAVHQHGVAGGIRPIEYAIECGHTQAVESLLKCDVDVNDRVWGNHRFVENLVQQTIDARQWGALAALLARDQVPLPVRIHLRNDHMEVQHQLTRVAKQHMGKKNADAFVHLIYRGVTWSPLYCWPRRPELTKLDPKDCTCSKCTAAHLS